MAGDMLPWNVAAPCSSRCAPPAAASRQCKCIPLSCHFEPGRLTHCHPLQVGVTSWGEGCAAGFPGVYSDVAYARGWIDVNIQVGRKGATRRGARLLAITRGSAASRCWLWGRHCRQLTRTPGRVGCRPLVSVSNDCRLL